jgi:hypothetical protein
VLAAVHESGSGPSLRFSDVSFRAANGGTADATPSHEKPIAVLGRGIKEGRWASTSLPRLGSRFDPFARSQCSRNINRLASHAPGIRDGHDLASTGCPRHTKVKA